MKLETERLILRNYTMDDIEDYWELVSDPNVGPRAGWPAYTDKVEAVKRLQLETTKPNQFAIILKENNKVIGSVELMECKKERWTNIKIEENSKEY